ncbi:unnamed protein product [Owenia fusiformis]|uniref:Uncharacterized protein n=1 Tax=Owenia fusiformis TaxID=6347 RepID=A0A8J1U5T4_OWEFU|nr:unnamed protein product [Owenia fusiformis]
MSCVHYKFKSSTDYDTVTFDGLHISLGDLKKAICQQKNFAKSSEFDLEVINAQTKQVFKEDSVLLPKNMSVIVSRVPVGGSALNSITGWESPIQGSPGQAKGNEDQLSLKQLTETADLASANASEENKILAMMSQSTKEYDSSNYQRTRFMPRPGQIPPASYICKACGRPGHFIQHCTAAAGRGRGMPGEPRHSFNYKRPSGIPNSYLTPVDKPTHGAYIGSSGHLVIPTADLEAKQAGKKKAIPGSQGPAAQENLVPKELLCMLCNDLLTDAVVIHCCGNSYCDECIRNALLEGDHTCPTCEETNISPDRLIPNKFLRTAVASFKNETGYTKVKKADMVAPPVVEKAPTPPPPEPVRSQPPPSNPPITGLPPHVTIVQRPPAPSNDVPPTPTKDEFNGPSSFPASAPMSSAPPSNAMMPVYSAPPPAQAHDPRMFRPRGPPPGQHVVGGPPNMFPRGPPISVHNSGPPMHPRGPPMMPQRPPAPLPGNPMMQGPPMGQPIGFRGPPNAPPLRGIGPIPSLHGMAPQAIPSIRPMVPPPGDRPLTAEEFYRTKAELLEKEIKKKTSDPMEDFQKELDRKKLTQKIVPIPKSRSRSRSKTPIRMRKSRSRTRSQSRSRLRTRSRSRSRKSRSRSISRPRRHLTRSRSRSISRRRSRSFTPKRRRSFSRSFSRSPVRRRSRTRSRTPPYYYRRSISPGPRRRFSRTPPPRRGYSRSPSPYGRDRPFNRYRKSPERRFNRGPPERSYPPERGHDYDRGFAPDTRYRDEPQRGGGLRPVGGDRYDPPVQRDPVQPAAVQNSRDPRDPLDPRNDPNWDPKDPRMYEMYYQRYRNYYKDYYRDFYRKYSAEYNMTPAEFEEQMREHFANHMRKYLVPERPAVPRPSVPLPPGQDNSRHRSISPAPKVKSPIGSKSSADIKPTRTRSKSPRAKSPKLSSSKAPRSKSRSRSPPSKAKKDKERKKSRSRSRSRDRDNRHKHDKKKAKKVEEERKRKEKKEEKKQKENKKKEKERAKAERKAKRKASVATSESDIKSPLNDMQSPNIERRSSRTEEKSPRAEEKLSRATDRSPRTTDRSPRATDRSPQTTNRSPRATDRSPKGDVEDIERTIMEIERTIEESERPLSETKENSPQDSRERLTDGANVNNKDEENLKHINDTQTKIDDENKVNVVENIDKLNGASESNTKIPTNIGEEKLQDKNEKMEETTDVEKSEEKTPLLKEPKPPGVDSSPSPVKKLKKLKPKLKPKKNKEVPTNIDAEKPLKKKLKIPDGTKKIKKIKKVRTDSLVPQSLENNPELSKERMKKRLLPSDYDSGSSATGTPTKRSKFELEEAPLLDAHFEEDLAKDTVMIDAPELSKWERDDIDLDLTPTEPLPSRQATEKLQKSSLPKSIIEKAESVLANKTMKVSSKVSALPPKSPRRSPTRSKPKSPQMKSRLGYKSPKSKSPSRRSPPHRPRPSPQRSRSSPHRSRSSPQRSRSRTPQRSYKSVITSPKKHSPPPGRSKGRRVFIGDKSLGETRDRPGDHKRKVSDSMQVTLKSPTEDKSIDLRKIIEERTRSKEDRKPKSKISLREEIKRENEMMSDVREKKYRPDRHKHEKSESIERDNKKKIKKDKFRETSSKHNSSEKHTNRNGEKSKYKSEETSQTNNSNVKLKAKVERKESIMDEDKFEPDYEESESESEEEPAPRKVPSKATKSRSQESEESDSSDDDSSDDDSTDESSSSEEEKKPVKKSKGKKRRRAKSSSDDSSSSSDSSPERKKRKKKKMKKVKKHKKHKKTKKKHKTKDRYRSRSRSHDRSKRDSKYSNKHYESKHQDRDNEYRDREYYRERDRERDYYDNSSSRSSRSHRY